MFINIFIKKIKLTIDFPKYKRTYFLRLNNFYVNNTFLLKKIMYLIGLKIFCYFITIINVHLF
jgi:hypothetical protein